MSLPSCPRCDRRSESAGATLRDVALTISVIGTGYLGVVHAADTSYVFTAAQSLAPHLGDKALVVGKSTVTVGTAAQLRDRLQQGAPEGVQVRLAWNPEFLREGFAIEDTVAPPGSSTAWTAPPRTPTSRCSTRCIPARSPRPRPAW